MSGLKPGHRARLNVVYIALAIALVAACSRTAAPSEPAPPSPTNPAQPEVEATATLPPPAATANLPSATEVPPRTDPEAPSAAEVARLALASQLGLEPASISLISEGGWTSDPIACQLDLPGGRVGQLLQGEHKQVILSAKARQYELWVYASVGGVTMAFPCAPQP